MRADAALMKRMNRETVLRALKACGEATKPELAKATGLSVVTVNALVAGMLADGDILPCGVAPSTGGRPSMRYAFNKNRRFTAVVFGHWKDGGDLIHFLLVNLSGEVVWRREARLSGICVESFAPALDEVFGQYRPVTRIVFGLPGEEFEGEISLIDYEALEGARFMPFYRDRYGVPVMFVNDVNAMVCGYCAARPELRRDTVVGLYFPRLYNPGAGVVIHGGLYAGKRNFAGLAALAADIDWLGMDYADRGAVVENLARIASVYACVLAPSRIVLYGDFLDPSFGADVARRAEARLLGKFPLSIDIPEDMERDFQAGLIALSGREEGEA